MSWLLLACFVLSGATGLALELVWVRQLQLVFGSTTLAISTVLCTFMGGLALGSWQGGRMADRLRVDPLWVYAACEAGIAVFALVIPLLLGEYPSVAAWLSRCLEERPTFLLLARFALCGLVLLPPTVLMGATLPLLSRRVVRSADELGMVGRRVGGLYAANTAGAVLGVALTGFWLLPTLGVRATNRAAIATDLLLAAAIAVASWKHRRRPASVGPERGTDLLAAAASLPAARALAAAPALLSPQDRRLALGSFALSGGIAMTLEVLWSRALALVIGSSVYSFTLILIVFLLGLSGGAAWIGRPAASSPDPLGRLALAFTGIGAAVAVTHVLADDLPYVFLSLVEGTTLDVGAIVFIQGLVAAVAIAPTAGCLGAVMPLAVRAYAGAADAVGRDVGRAYAANTVGAIVGSFAGGFVVLPSLGLERGVRAAALADLALAALLVARSPSRRVRRVAWIACPLIAAYLVLAPRWNVSVLTSGVFRIAVAKRFAQSGEIYTPELLYYRDGTSTTVTVENHGGRLALKNNGKVEASSVADMPTQILVGLAPVLLHGGREQRVAVIGYGSGVTVGAIAEAPQVFRVDVVEIEAAVYEAADRFFGPYNHRPESNPKVRRFLGDGRTFLRARAEKYDVIVSEPSNPWIAGVASLFSREFYAFAKEHLAEDGVFCQWAQLYELGPRNVKTIYRTFHEAFPYVYALSAADLSADTILVGSRRPLSWDLARLDRAFADPHLSAELARGGIRSTDDLVSLLILGPDEIASFAAGGDVHTDDNGLLEFAAPRDLLAAGRGPRFADAIYGDAWPYGHLDAVGLGVPPGREARLARALIAHGKRREAAAWIARVKDEPEAAALRRLLALAATRDFVDPELPLAAGGPPFSEPSPSMFSAGADADRDRAARALRDAHARIAEARWEDAWRILRGLPLPADTPDGRDVKLAFAFVLYKTLRLDEAERVLEALAGDDAFVKRRPAVLYYLGRVRYGRGRFQDGAALLGRFADAHPELVPALLPPAP